ncbi:GxxExxY protein [Desulfococcaceae bacterium HSG9]|nr:GxxExxY protein [Desulfococcaceae bacterium HSG9]
MYEETTYLINGCLFKIYNEIGNIWNEEIYEKVLEHELRSKGMRVERQKKFEVFYFDRCVGNFRIDLLVDGKIIVEVKAADRISQLHKAQLLSYLKGFDKQIGVLANFGASSVENMTFPNYMKNTSLKPFDYDKIRLPQKERIKDLLFIGDRILSTLGSGYFHHIYRSSFFYELRNQNIDFDSVKELTAYYNNRYWAHTVESFLSFSEILWLKDRHEIT